jgi:hypothetical protein
MSCLSAPASPCARDGVGDIGARGRFDCPCVACEPAVLGTGRALSASRLAPEHPTTTVRGVAADRSWQSHLSVSNRYRRQWHTERTRAERGRHLRAAAESGRPIFGLEELPLKYGVHVIHAAKCPILWGDSEGSSVMFLMKA